MLVLACEGDVRAGDGVGQAASAVGAGGLEDPRGAGAALCYAGLRDGVVVHLGVLGHDTAPLSVFARSRIGRPFLPHKIISVSHSIILMLFMMHNVDMMTTLTAEGMNEFEISLNQ